MQQDLINKKIAVFFYDGKTISKRVGTLLSYDTWFIYLKTSISSVEAISKKNIVRFLVVDSGMDG